MNNFIFDAKTYAIALVALECAYVICELVLSRLKKKRRTLEKNDDKR